MYTCILSTNFGLVRLVSFTTVHEQEANDTVLSRNEFLLLLIHEIALKRVCWINLQRRKRTECVKLPQGTLV